MQRFLKQPLVHFLLAGALLFALDDFVADDSAELPVFGSAIDQKQIVVSREALLNFIQFRAQAFNIDAATARYDSLTPGELDQLVSDFVREEVFYREAQNLNLAEGDYSIRQRLVQKMEFLLENTVIQGSIVDEAELRSFYSSNADVYQVDPQYSFVHVFFDANFGGMESARNRALMQLENLQTMNSDAVEGMGDPYPFYQYYLDRTRDLVRNNFDAAFVAALDSLNPDTAHWYGPIASPYGQHLVMLSKRTDAFTPAFETVRDRVLEDWRYLNLTRLRQAAKEQLLSEYEVSLEL